MTKILNYALKIKGVVGRVARKVARKVARAKSSDPAIPQNLERAPRVKTIECIKALNDMYNCILIIF